MNISKLLLFIILIFYSINVRSQYKYVTEYKFIDSIPADEDINALSYKIKDNAIWQLRKINSDNPTSIVLKATKYSFNSDIAVRSDTLFDLPNFQIQDLDFNDNYLFISGNSKFFYYNLKSPKNIFQQYNKEDSSKLVRKLPPFRNCDIINDSIVLLSTAYNYHPYSNDPGAYISLFNLNTNTFKKTIFTKVQGIALTHLNLNLIARVNQKIFLVTPLTGKLLSFDLDLNVIDSDFVNVFSEAENKENLILEKELDSIIITECERIDKFLSNVRLDSLKEYSKRLMSNVYGKSFVYDRINSLSLKYSYVEKIFNVNDSLLGIIVHKKDENGHDDFCDLYLFDGNKKQIVRYIKNWKCHIVNPIKNIEDVLTVNLQVGMFTFPQFKNQDIFFGTYLSKDYYEGIKSTNVDDFGKIMYNIIRKKGYRWGIIKYKY